MRRQWKNWTSWLLLHLRRYNHSWIETGLLHHLRRIRLHWHLLGETLGRELAVWLLHLRSLVATVRLWHRANLSTSLTSTTTSVSASAASLSLVITSLLVSSLVALGIVVRTLRNSTHHVLLRELIRVGVVSCQLEETTDELVDLLRFFLLSLLFLFLLRNPKFYT